MRPCTESKAKLTARPRDGREVPLQAMALCFSSSVRYQDTRTPCLQSKDSNRDKYESPVTPHHPRQMADHEVFKMWETQSRKEKLSDAKQ